MRKKRWLVWIGLWFVATNLWAQAKTEMLIEVRPMFGAEELQLEKASYELNGEAVQFTTLKLYLTNFKLLAEGEVVWQERKSYHLLSLESPASMQLAMKVPSKLVFDQIQFDLGTDSLTNVSGAFGGDLDPVKGMYWTWNSGYINFKLEGTYPLCPTRNHAFEYHIGGYAAPHQTVRTLRLPAEPGQNLVLQPDIKVFLSELDLTEEHTVLSPGENAARLATLFAALFETHETEK